MAAKRVFNMIGLDPGIKNLGFVFINCFDKKFQVAARYTVELGNMADSKNMQEVYWSRACRKFFLEYQNLFKQADYIVIEQQYKNQFLNLPLKLISTALVATLVNTIPEAEIKIVNANAVKARFLTPQQRVNYEGRKAAVRSMCLHELDKALLHGENDREHDQADALLCALYYLEQLVGEKFVKIGQEAESETKSVLPLKKRGRKPSARPQK
jgi:Holliday junction resolvasome RuvABC endonuclease subunit